MFPFDILVITDSVSCEAVGRTVESTVMALLKSSFSPRAAILLREKTLPQSEVVQQLERLQPVVQAAGAKLLVHSYPDLALRLGLAGVHLASTVAVETIRSQIGNRLLLGVSRHGSDRLDVGDVGCADYATISPIYRPTSKPDDRRETLGLIGLKSCTQRSVRPLVALGGLKPGRVAATIAQGAAAVAVSGALLQAKNLAAMLDQLCHEVDQGRSGRWADSRPHSADLPGIN